MICENGRQLAGNTVQIHPQLPIEWQVRELFDGTLYFDPNSDAEAILTATRSLTTNALANQFAELGSGTRSIVLDGGSLAVKRCVAGNQPHITGFAAVAANVALAAALDKTPTTVGKYQLRACMPRGYFQPKNPWGQPTWAMDRIGGENAQGIIHAPQEATDFYQTHRDTACRAALEQSGVDPLSVFLDSAEYGNIIVDSKQMVLTVIDVAAPYQVNP